MSAPREGFDRSLGLAPALAINLATICGIGPFVTIPLLVSAMGGPPAVIAWIAGAALALADGLIWAELGAAIPATGGTYVYLREAFERRTGRLMPFLFVWTAIIAMPLVLSTGVIGIVQYLGYYVPALSAGATAHAVSVGLVAVALGAAYRGTKAVGRLGNALCLVMFLTVALVIAAAFSHFSAGRAFTFAPGAFRPSRTFFAGFGSGLLIALYDYAGYSTSAYLAGEVRDPGRLLPRSILASILIMMGVYLTMNIGVLGVLPWREIAASQSVGALVIERTWGVGWARLVTGLVIVTAFASVFGGLLGASRIPYNAAKDGVFFSAFGRLHPTGRFPRVALLVMGAVTAVGTLFPLDAVIQLLSAALVLVQSFAQIAAFVLLRRTRPDLKRPFRTPAYGLVAAAAAAGWACVFIASGPRMMLLSVAWVGAGTVAFEIWARRGRVARC